MKDHLFLILSGKLFCNDSCFVLLSEDRLGLYANCTLASTCVAVLGRRILKCPSIVWKCYYICEKKGNDPRHAIKCGTFGPIFFYGCFFHARSRVNVCVFETIGALGLNKSWVLTLVISWMKWFANVIFRASTHLFFFGNF